MGVCATKCVNIIQKVMDLNERIEKLEMYIEDTLNQINKKVEFLGIKKEEIVSVSDKKT